MPFVLIVLLLAGAASPAWAEGNPKKSETAQFSALVERLRDHPEILAYAEKAESQRFYGDGEQGLPDPMLMFGAEDYAIGRSMSRDQQQKMVGFRQEIPRLSVREAKVARGHAESQKTRLMADYAFAAMKARLITALAELRRVREQENIYRQQESLLKAERLSLAGRVGANQESIGDLALQEADRVEVSLTVSELGQQEHEIEATLVNMLGQPVNAALPDIKPAAWKSDVGNTYPVKITGQDVTVARQEIKQREGEFGPNLLLQGNYARMYGGDNAATISVGVSVPLWSSSSQKPRLSGAKAGLRAAEAELGGVERQTVERLSHLRAQIATSAKKLELLKTKQNSLEQSASAALREYEAGKTDLPSVLKAKRDALGVKAILAAERAKRTSLIADFNRFFIEETTL
jgi:outer membrane protein, heavy metal efflux system